MFNDACAPSFVNPYPDCTNRNALPEVPENKVKTSRSYGWLKYLFACCFCGLLVAFITFLVLFILAISGGLGPVKGRMMPAEIVTKIDPIINDQLIKQLQTSQLMNKLLQTMKRN